MENTLLTEFLTHSAEILSEIPIVGELGQSEFDRSVRDRAKRPVSAWRGDLFHLSIPQEHKFEKVLFYERH